MMLLICAAFIFIVCISHPEAKTCNIKSLTSPDHCPSWTPKNKALREPEDGDCVYLTNDIGAACLDGSVPVFYYRAGSASTKFHIYFEGGGACVGVDIALSPKCFNSCSQRADGGQGSSNDYPAISNFNSEYMSTNATLNPVSYDWNTIYVKYCDGGMFLGDNDVLQPTNDGKLLWYRGRRIMVAVFNELVNNYNFRAATDVLVSGCSAGAAAVYAHSSFIKNNYVPDNAMFLAMPDSSFFIEDGVEFRLVIDWMALNQDTKNSLDPRCVADHPQDPFQCNWPQYTAPYVDVLTFALQSQYDLFQLNCEVDSNLPGRVNEYAAKFRQIFFEDYVNKGEYSDLHGAFVDSCSRHCGAWDGFEIDGVFSGQAQLSWYDNHEPGAKKIWFQNETYPCFGCCGRFG